MAFTQAQLKNAFAKIASGARQAIFGLDSLKQRNVHNLTVPPITPASGAAGVARAASGVRAGVKAASNYVARQFTNPLAGVTVREGSKALGKRLLGGTTAGLLSAGGAAAGYAATQNSPDLVKLAKKGALVGLGFAANPITTAGGLLAGYGKSAVDKIEDLYRLNSHAGLPNPSQPTHFWDEIPQRFSSEIPNLNNLPNFNGLLPTLPDLGSLGGSASFSPSINVGGMGGDSLPLPLILALLGLGGGYLLGKRKRKKYKKRKRR